METSVSFFFAPFLDPCPLPGPARMVKMPEKGLPTSMHMPPSFRHGWRILLGMLFLALTLAACSPSNESTAPSNARTPRSVPHGAATPDAAVSDLIAHLRRNALSDVARTALPAPLHARVEAGWRTGKSRWPLSELPFDDHLPGMLKGLTAEGAERKLNARFKQQLAGQTKALQDAARGLGLFGKQYLGREGQYNAQQRQHYVQLIDAMSAWAQKAPLGDPARGKESIHLMVNGATRSGLKGDDDLTRLGMEASLKALVPLYIAGKQVLGLYGLGIDATLASVRAETVKTERDKANVRVRYTLAGKDIDTVMKAVKVDGRWYLADYLEDAEASLPPPEPEPEPMPTPAPVTKPETPAGR